MADTTTTTTEVTEPIALDSTLQKVASALEKMSNQSSDTTAVVSFADVKKQLDGIDDSVSAAATSATNAAKSETNAASSAETAQTIAAKFTNLDEVANSATEANEAAAKAITAASGAETAAANAEDNALKAQSYATGDAQKDGVDYREGQATDNAKYYAKQAAVSATSSSDSQTAAAVSETNAKTYMESAKVSADNAEAITGVGIATTAKAGLTKPDGTSIKVTADGTISAESGHTIKDESGTAYTKRANLVFSGADVTDDEENDATVVSTSGGSTIVVTTTETTLYGQMVTVTDGTFTKKAIFDSTGTATIKGFLGGGTCHVSASDGNDTADTDIEIAGYGKYTANIAFYHAFAYHYSENDSSPASVTYPAGYDNSDWGDDPFYVDLSTGKPHYGNWDPTTHPEVNFLYPKSCMLNYDGTVAYYLNENDETKREDGSASDVANTAFGGNAMMEWAQDGKQINWGIIPDSDGKGYTFILADKTYSDKVKPYNHYNCEGKTAKHFYTPKYFGSVISGKMRSISGQGNLVDQNGQTEINYALANNLDSAKPIWDTEVCADWELLCHLCVLLSKSTNTQAKFGYGRCNAGNAIGQGTMNGKGMFWGSNNQTGGVKVFGMENPWGNLWRRIRGLVTGSGTVLYKLTYGTQDGSTATGYNATGSGYKQAGTYGGTSGGYISHMAIKEDGVFPNTASGSDSTYYCDGFWFSSGCYAFVGGSWNASSRGGAFCVLLDDAFSHSNSSLGAALSCKPLS